MAVILKWVVIFLAVLNFGFMTVDGARALTKGDYFRPNQGEYAGKLGPWSIIVSKVGIEPESGLMKTIFLAWGICGLVITVCYATNLPWAWKGMLIANICSLWYLMPGTASSSLQIIFLLVLRSLK